MGVMSKKDRLPERPKPPTLDEINEDITTASAKDPVFLFGKDKLPRSQASTPQNSQDVGGINSSTVSEGDNDTSQVDPQAVEESYHSVLRLINLYSQLKDAPAQLREQFAHLKDLGDGMVASIAELRDLQQKFEGESKMREKGETVSPQSTQESKGKTKRHKRK